jgi:hypothetical protein
MASPAWPFVGTEALANGIVTGYQLRMRYDAWRKTQPASFK